MVEAADSTFGMYIPSFSPDGTPLKFFEKGMWPGSHDPHQICEIVDIRWLSRVCPFIVRGLLLRLETACNLQPLLLFLYRLWQKNSLLANLDTKPCILSAIFGDLSWILAL